MNPNPVEKFINALSDKDHEALASLFNANGSINDLCPTCGAFHVYGREAVHMFYQSCFASGKFVFIRAVRIEDRYADFLACYDGYAVLARAHVHISLDGETICGVTVKPL